MFGLWRGPDDWIGYVVYQFGGNKGGYVWVAAVCYEFVFFVKIAGPGICIS